VHTALSEMVHETFGWWSNVTPMTHFALDGDLPMCRYLHHVRGAATTAPADEHLGNPDVGVSLYPTLVAAWTCRWDVVKWLYQHGAKHEILGESALSACFHVPPRGGELKKGAIDLAKWLLSEGLLEDDEGETCQTKLYRFIFEMQRQNSMWEVGGAHRALLELLEELLEPNDAFDTFLLGTVQNPPFSLVALQTMCASKLGSARAASVLVDEAVSNGKGRVVWDLLLADVGRTISANACLAPFGGVLEKIGNFVGIIKSKARIKRLRDARHMVTNLTEEDLRSIRPLRHPQQAL